jgi:hypothetical protein
MPEYTFDCGYCFKISDIKTSDEEETPKYCPFCGEMAEEVIEDELDFDA